MGDVERVVKAMPGVAGVNINLVWEPFWSPEKIEPRVRAYMGLRDDVTTARRAA